MNSLIPSGSNNEFKPKLKEAGLRSYLIGTKKVDSVDTVVASTLEPPSEPEGGLGLQAHDDDPVSHEGLLG